MTEILYNPEQFYLLISFLIYAFFIIVAEWKKDFVYFTVCIILSIEMTITTLQIQELNIIISLVFMSLSAYFTILAIGHVPILKKYLIEFRETLGF